MTPCMDVYKAKIKPHGSPKKSKWRILVRGYLHNMDLFGDNWSPTDSVRTLK